jgi:hypothetical protein
VTGEKRRRHGLTKTPTYYSWQAAKSRCENPKNEKFKSYGGAGIHMCEAWRNSFDTFLADMGERPPGKTLDRLDQTKGYEPGNCQWATHAEQSRNRGTTRLYRWRAGWMTVREIAEAEGLVYNTFRKFARSERTIQGAVARAKAAVRFA